MTISRRQILQAGGIGAVGLGARKSFAAPASASLHRPKKFLQLYLFGGVDALYTWDPKEAKEVDPKIKLPYSPGQIHESAGVKLAPWLHPIKSYAHRMAVLNGALSQTVAHEAGILQMQQLRLDPLLKDGLSITSRIGRILAPGAPLHEVRFGRALSPVNWLPPRGPGVVFDNNRVGYGALMDLGQDKKKIEAVLAALDHERQRCGVGPKCDELARTSGFFGRFVKAPPLNVPKFVAAELPAVRDCPDAKFRDLAQYVAELNANQVAVIMDALQREVAPAVYADVIAGWDSHDHNHLLQSISGDLLAQMLKELFDRMAATPGSSGGSLLDETGILIASEMGRFPFENVRQGKDHYPVFSAVLMGPGLRPGQYGVTDEVMVGREISLSNGKTDGPGRRIRPDLNDLARTVAEWVGMSPPERDGFHGRVLEFLLA